MTTNVQLPSEVMNGTVAIQKIERDISFLQRHIDLVLASLGMLLCLYLIWPAFHAVQLEGFTAQTQSLALIKGVAPGVEHDPYLPLVSQFIYQTRSAVIDILALIYRVVPDAGDLAFKSLVLGSFILLMISAMVFAKRWGNIHPIFSFFALVLTPGIPETAFFFNDNIVSAAFACIAIALISRNPKKMECLLSGAFLGLAILSRVDAVFMAPMVLGIAFFTCKNRNRQVFASVMICLSATLVLTVSAILHGFSLIDVFATARNFVVAFNDKNNWFWMRVYFFGLAALPLLLTGAWLRFHELKTQKEYADLLTFFAYPILLALFAPKATEVRYIFPLLAPMVALHAGTGLCWIYQQCRYGKEEKFRYATGVAVFSAMVMVFPVGFLKIHDGPRAMLGRLWSPILWERWQASVNETMARMQRLVAALDDQQVNILISTHYNDEFYSRLRLMEAGFLPMRAAGSYPGCHGFSLFTKGNSTVVHIRTDPQYRIAPINLAYNAALQISSALSCESILSYHKAYITTFGPNEAALRADIYANSPLPFNRPLIVEFGDLRTRFNPNNPHLYRNYGILDFTTLSRAEVMETWRNAMDYASVHPERDPDTGKIVTIEEYEKYYYPRPGPTSQWLLKVRQEIDFSASRVEVSGADHARE